MNLNNFNLFPTPVVQVKDFITQEEILNFLDFSEQFEKQNHVALSVGSTSTYHTTYSILEEYFKQCRSPLESKIYAILDMYCDMYGTKQVKLYNTWVNYQSEKTEVKKHNHPCSVVSGAVYLKIPESYKLRFHNVVPLREMMSKTHDTPYSSETQEVESQIGDMILFPSWLSHSTAEIIGEKIVLSFNTLYR